MEYVPFGFWDFVLIILSMVALVLTVAGIVCFMAVVIYLFDLGPKYKPACNKPRSLKENLSYAMYSLGRCYQHYYFELPNW